MIPRNIPQAAAQNYSHCTLFITASPYAVPIGFLLIRQPLYTNVPHTIHSFLQVPHGISLPAAQFVLHCTPIRGSFRYTPLLLGECAAVISFLFLSFL